MPDTEGKIPPNEQEQLDFSEVLKEPYEKKDVLSKCGERLIERAERLLKLRGLQILFWNSYLRSKEFRKEKDSMVFLNEFTSLLYKSEIPEDCWAKLLYPLLRELLYEWNGSPICNYISVVIARKQIIYDERRKLDENRKDRKKIERRRRRLESRGSSMFLRAMTVLFLIFIVSPLIISYVQDSMEKRSQRAAEEDAESILSSESTAEEKTEKKGIRIIDVLPVTYEELALMENERKCYEEVLHNGIAEGREFIEVEDAAEELGLFREDYEDCKERYENENSIEAAEEALGAYRSLERAAIEDRLMPQIFWGLVTGQMPEDGYRYCVILGIDQNEMKRLHALCNEEGEESMYNELMEYDSFVLSYSYMRRKMFVIEEE